MPFTTLNKYQTVFTEDPTNLFLSTDEDSFLGYIIESIEYSGDFYGQQICEIAKKSVVRLCKKNVNYNNECTIVDPLGFYRFAAGYRPIYEAPFIGLIQEKIYHVAEEIYNQQVQTLSHLTLDEIKKFLLAKVLLHELAHAWLDVNDFNLHHQGSVIFLMEEPMANCITLALAHLTNNADFIEFVEYFIQNQNSEYGYGYFIYSILGRQHNLSTMSVCADWRIIKGKNIENIIDTTRFNPNQLSNGDYFNDDRLAVYLMSNLIRIEIDNKINQWYNYYSGIHNPNRHNRYHIDEFRAKVKNALANQGLWHRASKSIIDECYIDINPILLI